MAGGRGAYRLLREPEMRLVPDTVQAIIGARIDSRPEGEKSVLQTAAVIGREFAVPILLRLVGGLAERLMTALHRLSAAGLVYETGGPREGIFAFRHPMVHDVAYRSLVSRRRFGLCMVRLHRSWRSPCLTLAALRPDSLLITGRKRAIP